MIYDKILVLDFGSQYNQLIARRIREMHVYSELVPYTTTAQEIIDKGNVKGIIFSGGPHSVYDTDSFMVDSAIFELGIPILGVCYGMQLLANYFDGTIEACAKKEYGKTDTSFYASLLFQNLPQTDIVWMSHGDKVTKLPKGFSIIASSKDTKIAGMENTEKKFYGVQFHPEVEHTIHGKAILNNFVFTICESKPNWQMESFIEEQIKYIKDLVKDDYVLCGLSGGVDSSVAATLIYKAIGHKLQCVFVDNGLLRKNEADILEEVFKKQYQIPLKMVDASKIFLKGLAGVKEPEQKRKIIGKTFIDIFSQTTKEFNHPFSFLAQGTLYTDVIESGTNTAQTIKSHHNVGGLPKNMPFKLLEPLNKLFKDEVRALGLALGLPKSIVGRQPFPGPGLAIRVMGEVTEEKLEIVRETDAILREEFANAKLNETVWQYFTILTNVQTVGVMGDNRTYSNVVAIRAVTSSDGMTADWAKIPYDVLNIVSSRIVNEVPKVNRVVYDITSKPPGTIEWE